MTTTRKQGAFPYGGKDLAEAEANLAELEAVEVEAKCNRCAGRGTSWWQKGTGSCMRCGGTGRAADGLAVALRATRDRIEFFGTPAGRWSAWVHRNWCQGGNGGATHVLLVGLDHALLLGADIDDQAPAGSTLRALFDAVAEGRQVGPIRPETGDTLRAERHSLRRARRAG